MNIQSIKPSRLAWLYTDLFLLLFYSFLDSLFLWTNLPTCKLLVTGASTTKLGDELARQLEDEDSASFVVNHDHMTVLVDGHSLWPHKPPRAKLRLMDAKYKQQEERTIKQNTKKLFFCIRKSTSCPWQVKYGLFF